MVDEGNKKKIVLQMVRRQSGCHLGIPCLFCRLSFEVTPKIITSVFSMLQYIILYGWFLVTYLHLVELARNKIVGIKTSPRKALAKCDDFMNLVELALSSHCILWARDFYEGHVCGSLPF